MSRRNISILVVLVLGTLGFGIWYFFFTQGVPGFWGLAPGESSFYFSSVKNGDIEERHTIQRLDGKADFNGDFIIRLDLTSLETGIDIRNERMREFLFEVDTYPVARINGSVNFTDIAEIAVGEGGTYLIPATVKLHGVEREMDFPVLIERPEWNRVVITPSGPIVIEAEDFNLTSGLETLRGLAGLESISTSVPIDFRLVFKGTSKDGTFQIRSD